VTGPRGHQGRSGPRSPGAGSTTNPVSPVQGPRRNRGVDTPGRHSREMGAAEPPGAARGISNRPPGLPLEVPDSILAVGHVLERLPQLVAGTRPPDQDLGRPARRGPRRHRVTQNLRIDSRSTTCSSQESLIIYICSLTEPLRVEGSTRRRAPSTAATRPGTSGSPPSVAGRRRWRRRFLWVVSGHHRHSQVLR
jgi:hypothetical protein